MVGYSVVTVPDLFGAMDYEEKRISFIDDHLIESSDYFQDSKVSDYYIYSTVSGIYPFVKFEEEISAINDYCCFVQTNLREKVLSIKNSKTERFSILTDKQRLARLKKDIPDFEFFIGKAEIELGYISDLLTWERMTNDINRCSMLALWLAYLESALDEIAHWFCEKKSVSFGRKPRMSTNVEHCLQKIGECYQCDVILACSKELVYYRKIQKIRNRFMHREWGQVSDRDKCFRLNEVIGFVSIIIARVEQGALDARVIS